MNLLNTIDSPADLKKLSTKDLPLLATELRDFMIDTVSKHGGHLAPSLGVVELTLALHYVYDTPKDKIVWDVGHQAYAHKIITGRRDSFNTLRQYGGISGFPRISESDYDALSVGHASTSISAALGMAKARDIKKENHKIVALIGDGSLSGGLAFEGLNNLGMDPQTNMTVILNDNEMSISRNVGALSRHLTRMITDKRYNKLKTDIWELLGSMSNVGKRIRDMVHNVDDAMKRLITPGKFFENMGLRYIGPINGHDIPALIDVLQFARNAEKQPVLIHVLTKKGKGYRFAEDDATKYHGIGSFSKFTGNVKKSTGMPPSYSSVFGKTLCQIAEKDNKIVAITAAMPDGTGLQDFRDKYPNRFFDVGIAEGHAVTFAAGLALEGIKPVVAMYSTFMPRAFDHIIHDTAIDNLNVIFCMDRAGLVGNDGPTHHGSLDISFLRIVPNATILVPSDELELRDMLYTATKNLKGPVFIRYPRGNGRGIDLSKRMQIIKDNAPVIKKTGSDLLILSAGDMIGSAEKCAEILKEHGINATIADARFVKPLNTKAYIDFFNSYSSIVTLENNAITGGFGSAVMELSTQLLNEKNIAKSPRFIPFGYPDEFVPHGDLNNLLHDIGHTPQQIAEKILAIIKN